MLAPDWRSTAAVTCGFAVLLVVVVWGVRKNSCSKSKGKESEKSAKEDKSSEDTTESDACENANEVKPSEANDIKANQNASQEPQVQETEKKTAATEIPEPRWVKVGQVEELFLYPLKSGRGKEVKSCNFTEHGISVKNQGQVTLRDRMFLVYNEETQRFQTARQYPTLILVSLSAVDSSKVKLEAVGMPSIVFKVPETSKKNSEAIECTMWWGETAKCIDCGPEPAEWLSRFLTGTNSGLRLGYSLLSKRSAMKEPWEKFTKVYKNFRDEDMGLFSDVMSYMLISKQSLDNLNERLEKPVPALQLRPNIVVSAPEAFAEDKWEWIKIGERAVIRNVKPCTRCKMTKVDPETGVADKEEPLKTMKSYREIPDPEIASLEGKAPAMGILCGLYITGKVKVGDDVFVHVPEDSTESNHKVPEEKTA